MNKFFLPNGKEGGSCVLIPDHYHHSFQVFEEMVRGVAYKDCPTLQGYDIRCGTVTKSQQYEGKPFITWEVKKCPSGYTPRELSTIGTLLC